MHGNWKSLSGGMEGRCFRKTAMIRREKENVYGKGRQI